MGEQFLAWQVAVIGRGRDLAARAWEATRDERGQTSAEYMGMLLVVAAIMVALAATGIAKDIATNVQGAIDAVFKKLGNVLGGAGH